MNRKRKIYRKRKDVLLGGQVLALLFKAFTNQKNCNKKLGCSFRTTPRRLLKGMELLRFIFAEVFGLKNNKLQFAKLQKFSSILALVKTAETTNVHVASVHAG